MGEEELLCKRLLESGSFEYCSEHDVLFPKGTGCGVCEEEVIGIGNLEEFDIDEIIDEKLK